LIARIAAGRVSFTPSIAGTYTYKIVAAATASTAAQSTLTYTVISENTSSSAGVACSTAYNTSSCTQVLGGSAIVTLTGAIGTDATGGTRYTVSSSGVGSIGSFTASTEDALTEAGGYTAAADFLVGTTTQATYPSTSLDIRTADTTAGTESGAVQGFDLVLTSAVAGTQTITVTKKDANGTPTSTYTQSITWTTAASTGINAAKSTLYVDTDADGCVAPGASKAADSVLAAAAAISRTPVNTAVDVCIIARDANDNLLTVASATVTGSFGRSTTTVQDTGSNKSYNFDLAAASAVLSGTETITAVVIDAFGNAAVLTTTLSVYGSLKAIALSSVRGSAYAAADQATTDIDTYTEYVAATGTDRVLVVGIRATDANSAVIDLNAAGIAAANSVTTSNWTVDSDKVAGAPADRTSQTLGSAINDLAPENELSSSRYGSSVGNVQYIVCGTKPEKLTLTAWGKDSDGNWLKSNSLDVYCAGAASTVTVTPSATSIASGSSGTVNVSVKDADGYPVADATSVTLAANNGSVVAPSSKTTVAGAFATAANLIVGSDSASTTVSAIAGGKTGTATVTITGGSSNASLLTQIDALNAKIVALNALIAKIMKKLGVK
jgi:epidermal growth factor receptor substrate 15